MKRGLYLFVALLAFAPALAAPRNPLDALRVEDLRATRERPLFAPTRRPPPPPPVRVEAPPAPPVEEKAAELEPSPFELIGAVVGEHASYALLRNRKTNDVTRLRAGDDAEGWRLATVGLRSVVLEREGREEQLALTAPQAAAEGTTVAGQPGEDDPAAPTPVAELRRVGVGMRANR